jgi:hypothetical protein
MAGLRFDRPAVGVCFDIGKIGPGKYGQMCWEIFWRAIPPREIVGSQLFEGSLIERENVYCLAFHNPDDWRMAHIVNVLELDADFLKVSATPRFCEGEVVLRQPLVAAGQINETGSLVGISYNARLALGQVRREKSDASSPVAVPNDTAAISQGTTQLHSKVIGPAMKVPPAVTASLQSNKWWRVWRP